MRGPRPLPLGRVRHRRRVLRSRRTESQHAQYTGHLRIGLRHPEHVLSAVQKDETFRFLRHGRRLCGKLSVTKKMERNGRQ